MVYQVIEEQRASARVVQTLGTRDMAEQWIARSKPATRRKKLSIREVSVREDSPALHYPYLPGVGR